MAHENPVNGEFLMVHENFLCYFMAFHNIFMVHEM